MRNYDFEELKREEMEVVNGGTSQINTTTNTSIMEKLQNVFNNIKEYFTR